MVMRAAQPGRLGAVLPGRGVAWRAAGRVAQTKRKYISNCDWRLQQSVDPPHMKYDASNKAGPCYTTFVTYS